MRFYGSKVLSFLLLDQAIEDAARKAKPEQLLQCLASFEEGTPQEDLLFRWLSAGEFSWPELIHIYIASKKGGRIEKLILKKMNLSEAEKGH